MGLRKHGDTWVRKDAPYKVDGPLSETWSRSATDGEELGEDFIGGPEVVFSEGAADVDGSSMPAVSRTEKRDPVEGISKEMPHAGFLGVP
jgi:hypothetical protein